MECFRVRLWGPSLPNLRLGPPALRERYFYFHYSSIFFQFDAQIRSPYFQLNFASTFFYLMHRFIFPVKRVNYLTFGLVENSSSTSKHNSFCVKKKLSCTTMQMNPSSTSKHLNNPCIQYFLLFNTTLESSVRI